MVQIICRYDRPLFKVLWLTLTTYLNFSRQLHVIKLLNAAVVVVDGRNEGLEAAMVFIYATRS